MSWNSGPCDEDWDPQERNVVPERDDEESERDEAAQQPLSRAIEHGGTHFAARFRPNQRSYPGRPRGTARDSG